MNSGESARCLQAHGLLLGRSTKTADILWETHHAGGKAHLCGGRMEDGADTALKNIKRFKLSFSAIAFKLATLVLFS